MNRKCLPVEIVSARDQFSDSTPGDPLRWKVCFFNNLDKCIHSSGGTKYSKEKHKKHILVWGFDTGKEGSVYSSQICRQNNVEQVNKIH